MSTSNATEAFQSREGALFTPSSARLLYIMNVSAANIYRLGDLGIWASDVETALERHFAYANRWGCILLLDEADVFLAARTPSDHLRNSLVSGKSASHALTLHSGY